MSASYILALASPLGLCTVRCRTELQRHSAVSQLVCDWVFSRPFCCSVKPLLLWWGHLLRPGILWAWAHYHTCFTTKCVPWLAFHILWGTSGWWTNHSVQGVRAEVLRVGRQICTQMCLTPMWTKHCPPWWGRVQCSLPTLPPGSQLVPREFGELSISLCCWQVRHSAVAEAKSTLGREERVSTMATLYLGPLSKH